MGLLVEGNKSNLKLSVLIVAYNSERFIREAIDSVLNQDVDFKFEVIIGDDASTDGTRKIIEQYVERYPSLVSKCYQYKNSNGRNNYPSLIERSKGEYIARLDADDLFYPGKLKDCVNYLDCHEDVGFVYHDMEIIEKDLVSSTFFSKFYNQKFVPEKANIDHLVKYGNFLVHSSKVFRKKLFDVDDFRLQSRQLNAIRDYYSHIQNCRDGWKAGRIDKVLGGYRIHPHSRTSKNNIVTRRLGSLQDIVTSINLSTNCGANNETIKQGLSHAYFSAAMYFLCLGEEQFFLDAIDSSVDSHFFFSDKHQYVYENRHLFQQLKKEFF
ncbi:glycosyltransferase [Agarivorans sp. B2Z047]|nr:glycosyltransferase [Agarivorans sp. B2Z047]